LSELARIGLQEGGAALERIRPQLFTPVKPMLAEPVDDIDRAVETLGEAAYEFKFDGARVQVHKSGDEVRIYSRHLNEVTDSLPELSELACRLDAQELILEGEALGFDPEGRPLRFQDFMRRFRRKNLSGFEGLPVRAFFFDLILRDGDSLFDLPYRDRRALLEDLAGKEAEVTPSLITSSPKEAHRFFERSIEAGHEGLIAKAPGSRYRFGARGKDWLKIKRVETLDLVVIAADWGYGRRKGWLSNYHLACMGERPGELLTLGKTFKGLTDDQFKWMTERLLSLEVERDRGTVYVRPEVVVEVASNEIQESPNYDSGFALRFARIKRIRKDKPVREIDGIRRVRELYEDQFRFKGRLRR
jgi:DNA ligase-1